MSETFTKALRKDELPEGACRSVTVAGKTLAVFNVGGAPHALENACAHLGGPLGEGGVEAGVVACPWHGWLYDVKTGACKNMPKARVRSYPAKLEGEDILVSL